jgi:acylphosphatase
VHKNRVSFYAGNSEADPESLHRDGFHQPAWSGKNDRPGNRESSMENNIRARLIIEGRVQGVWFRESTRREASRLGVVGWVKNRSDGKVEVLAEGSEEAVRKLVTWCHHGPATAKVIRVRETEEAWRGEFASFDIVYSNGIW